MRYGLNKNISKYLTMAVLLMGALLCSFGIGVQAANTPNRSLTVSDSNAGRSGVDYAFKFDVVGNYNLGSVVFEICTEDPLPNQACTSPVGFNGSLRTLSSQVGETGFSVHPNSTNNRIVLGRVAQMTTATTLAYTLSNITNPSNNGTVFARIYTYSSNDGSGINIDDGGIAYAINNSLGAEAEVPPFLFFCSGVTIAGFDCRNNSTASGQFIDFGEFRSNVTATATSQLMVATNARSGYNISVIGSTLTSGNNTIAPLGSPIPSSSGASQFGMNLRANSSPGLGQDPSGPGSGSVNANYNIPNRFAFNGGDTVAGYNGTSNFYKYTVSYIVNINNNQRPGTYNTTLTYLCLANF